MLTLSLQQASMEQVVIFITILVITNQRSILVLQLFLNSRVLKYIPRISHILKQEYDVLSIVLSSIPLSLYKIMAIP